MMDINNIESIVEIQKGSNIKYEYDHKEEKLICDRFLHTPVNYFFNYGYIPKTLGGDNDEIDIIVLCDEAILPTCYIKCKILGVLETEDEHGKDPKIIAVPSDKIDPLSLKYKDISDIDKNTLDKLIIFFETYKTLEPDKWVKVGKIKDKYEAKRIIQKGYHDYQKKMVNS